MNYKLLGYRQFTSKKNGRLYRMIAVMSPYSAAQKAQGCVGNAVEEIFLPDECDITVTEADIGKTVLISYSVQGGRAFVTDIEIKSK